MQDLREDIDLIPGQSTWITTAILVLVMAQNTHADIGRKFKTIRKQIIRLLWMFLYDIIFLRCQLRWFI